MIKGRYNSLFLALNECRKSHVPVKIPGGANYFFREMGQDRLSAIKVDAIENYSDSFHASYLEGYEKRLLGEKQSLFIKAPRKTKQVTIKDFFGATQRLFLDGLPPIELDSLLDPNLYRELHHHLIEKGCLPNYYTNIFMGHAGSSTPLHFDWYSGFNIYFQYRGHKTLVLFDSLHTPHLKSYRNMSSLYLQSLPQEIRYELARSLNASHIMEISPGDVIIIPPLCWHYLDYHSDAISFSVRCAADEFLEGFISQMYPSWKLQYLIALAMKNKIELHQDFWDKLNMILTESSLSKEKVNSVEWFLNKTFKKNKISIDGAFTYSNYNHGLTHARLKLLEIKQKKRSLARYEKRLAARFTMNFAPLPDNLSS